MEHVVVEARDSTESATRAALEQLGVAEAMPFAHLTEEERRLRRKLRVHGRQLGDIRNSKGAQQIDRLIDEVAYEHWHRMLFARFLAENNLLMYPDPENPVAVALEECEDLASQEGAKNGWELAARFATGMLPQIFRPDSPVFQLVLPPEHQQRLERLVSDLPQEVFIASDSLGWVYQFWQTKKKDEINASEVKIGARELPAVTQLFTEPYMVSFLLDNSLGAWWAVRQLTESDLKNAASEDELRAKAALPSMSLKYLRFVREDDGSWIPAAGTFDGWPESLSELKILDPCCGSGHFLVSAFLMLVPMRMERDGLSARDAVDTVLSENIHGLELDQRCVELAAFALALTAWKYPGAGGYRPLPELNVACSGLAISAKKEEWLTLAGDNTNLRLALEELYKQFKDAQVLGSLINPEASLSKGSLFELKWEEVGPLLTKALEGEGDDEKTELGVIVKGLSRAALLLADSYTLVITNVPFLGRGKQTDIQKDHCDSFFGDARSDLSTSMLRRCLELCRSNGTAAIVSPQVWLFQNSYTKLRANLLDLTTWNLIGKLGANAFQDMNWWAAVTLLSIISSPLPKVDHCIYGVDVGNTKDRDEKDNLLRTSKLESLAQRFIRCRPNSVVAFSDSAIEMLLCDCAKSTEGLSTGDGDRFLREFWEHPEKSYEWDFFHTTSREKEVFSGMSQVVRWEQGNGYLSVSKAARIQGHSAWKKEGILLSRMNKLIPVLYSGNLFDKMAVVITPNKQEYLAPMWSYLSSSNYHYDVRILSQNVAVASRTLAQVPFDHDRWTKVAEGKYPNGLPKPYSDDPTQWVFHGHPCGSVVWDEATKWTAHGLMRSDNTVLQVAAVRLLGYRWPPELDVDMELADEQREWVNRCEALLPYADDDGIVCIPPLRGEASAADRLLNLLVAAYGDAWSNDIQAQLLKNADHAGKTLETWLRDKFFTQHCKLFFHRPFIWHIWDGLRDGFAALINYHKLDAKLLESLIYTYLGNWISNQRQDKAKGVDGAEEKLVKAENLKKSLELILEGEDPYDTFIRWKPIEKQPMGWDPDLNDGVRLNIRPFLSVPDVGKKGAGVLRDRPNINWNKDRGKDVKSSPWYHLGPQYGGREGDRINDHHLSLAEKRSARKVKEKREF